MMVTVAMLSLMDHDRGPSVHTVPRQKLSVEKRQPKEPGRGKHSSRSPSRMARTCVEDLWLLPIGCSLQHTVSQVPDVFW